MGRSAKIVRQLEQFFEPYRMMFKELRGGGQEAALITMFLEKTLKNITLFFLGGAAKYLRIFASSIGGGWNLIKAGGRVFSRILYG